MSEPATTTGAKRLLLEIGVEELPASFLREGLASLHRTAASLLEGARLATTRQRVWGTPRRLALTVEGLPSEQPARREEIQGPPWSVAFRDDMPTKAAEGFARKNGVPLEALRKRETDKGDYVVAEVHEAGRHIEAVLAELLPVLCAGVRFPKTMRWGDGEHGFGRPVHWLVALLDDAVVPFTFAGIEAARDTRGHRFLAPGSVALTHAEIYDRVLRDAHVVVDGDERRRLMEKRLHAAASELGGSLVDDAFLLSECADLVEAPFVVPGAFDTRFLELPEAVVVSVMRDHQRYFALRGPDGRLMPRYLNVVNTAEAPQIIAEGNDRVLHARLADAQFFVAEDLKRSLSSRREKLDTVIFQRKLGTVGAKIDRVASIARQLAHAVGADVERAGQAAELAKMDLESLIVFEFPELQGVMGRYYADKEGIDPDVAAAIEEHYMPAGADAPVAPNVLGAVVGTADRADTLVGCFAIGLEPTGSSDPFALRRAAISIIRTALEGPIDVPIGDLIEWTYEQQPLVESDAEKTVGGAHRFLAARLRAYYRERYSTDVVEATLAAWPYDSIRDLDARMQAVAELRGSPDYAPLAVAFKRANNITSGDEVVAAAVDPALLEAGPERALYDTFDRVRADLDAATADRDYGKALAIVARELKDPIDRYFDEVLVMAEDSAVRANRLRLLTDIADAVKRIAHIHHLAEPQ